MIARRPVSGATAMGRTHRLMYPLMAAGLAVAALWSLCVGRYPIDPWSALRIVASTLFPLTPDWTHIQERIVLDARAPRVVMAALCGAGLAMGGGALQGVFRNPLVSPHILGVSSGASFGGALALTLGLSGLAMVGTAFAAGCATLVLVAALARSEGRSSTIMVVLTGIVVGALFSALVSLLKFLADPDSSLPAIVFWLMGSFAASNWESVAIACPLIGMGMLTIFMARFRINILSLGDDDAQAMGVRVERDRWVIFISMALIEGATVAFCGVIGWIGLLVPHAARLLVGSDQRRLIPACMLLGAATLLLVDTLARSLTAAEIPVGIITAILGTPLFAFLLRRQRRSESLT